MAIAEQRPIGEFVTLDRKTAPWQGFHLFLQQLGKGLEMLLDWQARSRGRRQLLALSDAALKDFGASRCDAEGEGGKPGWRG